MVWLNTFLKGRLLDCPHGRPLYSYLCSDDEFEELGHLLRTGTSPLSGQTATVALFCLYASEWWRRKHRGGPWKWEGILAGIGWQEISVSQRSHIVEAGLRYWRRPLLRLGARRRRLFLVTLACEGGLPLQLVTIQGTALRSYLIGVLDEFQLYRENGYEPEFLAKQASGLLPYSLQQEAVYRLSGQLIDEIWRLKSKVKDSLSPVRDLNRNFPNWRDRLPLLVPDDVARTLLNPLIERLVELTRAGVSGLRMSRLLRASQGGSWSLHAELVVPVSVSESQFANLLDIGHNVVDSRLPGRLELYLENENGNCSRVALATEIKSSDQRRFLLEVFKAATCFKDTAACETKTLHVTANTKSIASVALPGGYALLPDLPWVFVDKSGEQREFRLLGQGSVTTRHSEAFVAVLPTARPEPSEEGECECIAFIRDLGVKRNVFRICGSVTFRVHEDSVCRIRTAAKEDESAEYRLIGEVLLGVTGNELIYRGCPSLQVIDAEGEVESIEHERIEWRILGKQVWRRGLSPQCCGEVALRFMDDSTLRYRRDRVMIVPSNAQIQLRPSSHFWEGLIDLIGFGNVEVKVGSRSLLEVTISSKKMADFTRLDCKANSASPADISLYLTWPGGCKIEDFRLPYPSVGACFIAPNGKVLEDYQNVPVDRLSGIIATGKTTKECQYYVSGRLDACDVEEGKTTFGIFKSLEKVVPGLFQRDIFLLQEPLRNLFAVSREMDACVRLEIDASVGSDYRNKCRLIVSRFDLSLREDRLDGTVSLGENDLERLGKDVERLRVEAVPLWDPDAEISALEPVPGLSGRWQFSPDRRESGPWVIVGKDGDWNRIRPLLWEVPGKDDQMLLQDFDPKERGALETAVCISDTHERAAALDRLLVALAEDCSHPDWHQVYASIRRFRGLPAATLDLTDRIISTPCVAMMALLGASDTTMLSSVWSLLEELPFLWSLLPVKDWVATGRYFESSLRSELGRQRYPGDVNVLVQDVLKPFFEEAPKRQLGFETLVELMRVCVFGYEIGKTKCLKIAIEPATRRKFLWDPLEDVRQCLLNRYAEDRWPRGYSVSGWLDQVNTIPSDVKKLWHIEPEGTGYRIPVLNAPAVAAIAAACGIKVERSLIYEIRYLRSFDEQWFDEAYSRILAIAIGILFEQDPTRIGVSL